MDTVQPSAKTRSLRPERVLARAAWRRALTRIARIAASAALASAFSVLSAATPVAGADQNVQIVDYAFQPATVTIVVGDTVTWQNTADMQHTVTADDGSFDSGPMDPNDQFANLFKTAGTYTYHCSIHSQMTGTVIVLAAAPTATPNGTPAPTPPAGTLPPSFRTRVPVPTPTPAMTAPPSPGSGSGGQDSSGSLLPIAAVVVVAAVAVAAILVLRRRRFDRG